MLSFRVDNKNILCSFNPALWEPLVKVVLSGGGLAGQDTSPQC